MRAVILFVFSAFAFVSLVLAQSGSSLERTAATPHNRDTVHNLFGSPVSEVYQTPNGLRVTASFASNGSLCRAEIRSDDDRYYTPITDAELKPVLNELAPADARGNIKMGTFLDGTCLLAKPRASTSDAGGKPSMEVVENLCAECSGVRDDYERLTITKYGNTNEYSSVRIRYKRPECEALEKVQQ